MHIKPVIDQGRNMADVGTEAIEIQGEKPRKSEHPPTPYSPNAWAELTHFFWPKTPRLNAFRGTGVIFKLDKTLIRGSGINAP